MLELQGKSLKIWQHLHSKLIFDGHHPYPPPPLPPPHNHHHHHLLVATEWKCPTNHKLHPPFHPRCTFTSWNHHSSVLLEPEWIRHGLWSHCSNAEIFPHPKGKITGSHVGFSGFQKQKKKQQIQHWKRSIPPTLLNAIKSTSSWLPASPSNKDKVETLSSMAIHLEPVGGMEIVVLLFGPERSQRKNNGRCHVEGQQKHSNFWPRYLNDPILKIYFLHLFVQKLATNSHHFLAEKSQKMTQKWPRCHCQRCTALPILCPTNSSHAAWIRLPWTLAIQLGSTLRTVQQETTPTNYTAKQPQSLYRDSFFAKDKSMQMSPGQFWRGHLSTNTWHVPEFFEINLLSFFNIMHLIQRL